MSYVDEEDRKAGRIAIGIAAAAVIAGAGWWFWQRSKSEGPEVPVVADEQPAPEMAAPEDPPAVEHPLETAAPAEVVEDLPEDPDLAAQAALAQVFGTGLTDWVVTPQLARRLVATVDNIARDTRIEPLRPLRAPPTPFVVERQLVDPSDGTERITLAPANFARYDELVALLARTDATEAAAAYRRLYPRLQAAYEDLGYPGRYFNDRVVAVIDDLLATPERTGDLLLERPKVMYQFADPALESLSPGQKLLLRIGPQHARVVRQKLREIRAQIAAAPPADNDNKE